jgi:hypothetical protein
MSCGTATEDIQVGIYQDSGSNTPQTLIGTEKQFDNIGVFSAQWKEFDVSGQGMNVTSGTNYWIGINGSAGNTTLYMETAGADARHKISMYAVVTY